MTPVNQSDVLKALVADANEIIAAAKNYKSRFAGEAINWGDLSCLEARSWTNDSGDAGYTVHIEEVSPTAAKFLNFIAGALIAKGWGVVEVVGEW